MRALFHYLFSVIVLTVYGGAVCPFMAGLEVLDWGASVAVALALAFVARLALQGPLVERAPAAAQVRRQFALELALFLLAGVALAIYNGLDHGFPVVASGGKIVVAVAVLGYFTAADLGLARERLLARRFAATGQEMMLAERYLPLTGKFLAVALFCALFVGIILVWVVTRDLELLSSTGPEALAGMARGVWIEVLFILGALLAELANLAASYSANLRLFLDDETGALQAVAGGDYTRQVTVSRGDELGQVAVLTNHMISSLADRTGELLRTQDATIYSLASLAETRDNETGAHILRTQRYVRALARQLGGHPRFSPALSDERFVDLLYKSAPLHDIGKVGVPDAILLKPGKLDDVEWEEMQRHTIYGRQALKAAEEVLGASSFLAVATEIAYTHHEKWDGSGYPRGLAGEDIPISGRLMALADVFDALMSRRVYKPAFPPDKTKAIILEGRGRHFDPDLVDAFEAIWPEFLSIAAQFTDEAYADLGLE